MSEKGKKILETFNKALPGLSDQEMDKLLAFGEGVALMADRRNGAANQVKSQTEGRESA